jgi:hypothetical protein
VRVVPLPPGVPYDDQQTALFDTGRGWLRFEPNDLTALARSLADASGMSGMEVDRRAMRRYESSDDDARLWRPAISSAAPGNLPR